MRAAVGFDADEALVCERAQRGADCVAGEGVVRCKVLFAQRRSWFELAVEDPRPERVRERVDGGLSV